MMGQRGLGRLLSVLLGLLLASTVVTGQIAASMDLNRFVYHRYVAYTAAALACLHIYLHRKRLLAYFREAKSRAQAEPQPPAPQAGQRTPPLTRRGFLLSAASALAGFAAGRWALRESIPPLAGEVDVAQAYHQWSKPGYLGLLGTVLNWGQPLSPYKTYPGLRRIPLPRGLVPGSLSLEEAIQRRRSHRDFTDRALSLGELSHLLQMAGGITEPSYPFRAAPSAGALYPVEIYPVVNRVEGLPPGLYHFSVSEHVLEVLREGDFRLPLVAAAVGQEMPGEAAVTFIMTAIFQRTRWKYKERAYRYILLETGHIGQNLYLASTSLGLGCVAVGAFFDDQVNELLGLDGVAEATLYLVCVGHL